MNNKFKILLIIVISSFLIGCKLENRNENFKPEAIKKENFKLKNINTPTKIILYKNGKEIVINSDNKNFKKILNYVDNGLSGIKGALKTEMDFDVEKNGILLELDYNKTYEFNYKNDYDSHKVNYDKIFIDLDLKRPNYLNEFWVVSFKSNLSGLHGNFLNYHKFCKFINNEF